MVERILTSPQLKEVQLQILDQLEESLSGHILVIGDVGLDEYLLGEVSRISREAPVPVLDVKSQNHRLGLAANVAKNVSSLGGEVTLIGAIGDDDTGSHFKRLLESEGVSSKHLIEDPQRMTTRKSRLIAENHHVARVDFQRRQFLSSSVESQLIEKAAKWIPTSDVIIIEDYANGVLTELVTQEIISLAQLSNKKVLVDPAPTTPSRYYRRAHFVTPNRTEAFELACLTQEQEFDEPEMLLGVGSRLMDALKCQFLVITRGKDGMSLFSPEEVVHLPTYAREVYDVTGAGDTVVAALALGITSGMSLEKACILANFAAGVVVGQMGCVPCWRHELIQYILRQTHT